MNDAIWNLFQKLEKYVFKLSSKWSPLIVAYMNKLHYWLESQNSKNL